MDYRSGLGFRVSGEWRTGNGSSASQRLGVWGKEIPLMTRRPGKFLLVQKIARTVEPSGRTESCGRPSPLAGAWKPKARRVAADAEGVRPWVGGGRGGP